MDKKINIGEYSNFVIEVVDFIEGNSLLDTSTWNLAENNVLDDISLAKSFAWDEVYGDDEFTWSDIRSEKMSEIWEIIYKNDSYAVIDDILTELMEMLGNTIQQQLSAPHDELLDDILSDLRGCIYSRAFQGKKNDFFERILLVYQNGGWPCGWVGNWPQGDLMIYRINGVKSKGHR